MSKVDLSSYQDQNQEVFDSGSKENASSSDIVADKIENLLRLSVCKLQAREFDDQGHASSEQQLLKILQE